MIPITSFDRAAKDYENHAAVNLGRVVDTAVPADVLLAAATAQALLAVSFRLGDIAQAIREQRRPVGRRLG